MKFEKKRKKITLNELWNNVDFTKPSNWILIASNFSVIFFAFIDNLTATEVMWMYWIQSVIIGIFNFIRILSLKDFLTVGLKLNGKEVGPTKATKISSAIFFFFHYGFFHLIYAIFISSFPLILNESKPSGNFFLLFPALVFFINYGIEFYKEQTLPGEEKPNLGALMFLPYVRIIPMHLTIILGGFITAAGSMLKMNTSYVVIFVLMGIKTFVDLITHSINNFTDLNVIKADDKTA
jgi:hypothetical protein